MSSTTRERKTRRTIYTVLLSVCLFLGVICACLLVALVLIGKNLAAQSLLNNNCSTNNNNDTNGLETQFFNDESPSIINHTIPALDSESFNDTFNEISVKISVKDPNSRLLSTTVSTILPEPKWQPGNRLPRDVKPLHYRLKILPDLRTGLFNGTNNISIETLHPMDHFVLHGHNLNITDVHMYSTETDEQIDVISFHNDSFHQLWVVDLEDTLRPGTYWLILQFSGIMTGNRVGLYTSSYLDKNSSRRYIATTKFEPTYARQAFPCFDEPNYKAKYTIQIEKPIEDEYIALSNMNQIDLEEDSIPQVGRNTRLVSFNTSVPMSTYVLCFIVCDFKYTEEILRPKNSAPIKLRVYATPAQKEKTRYALEIGAKATNYYIDYFKIAYPLPKLDMIAIPDFVSGAMEHWGLLTYRETALLFDEQNSNAGNRQRVATVVAHELAHQWFGNMVTIDWWNDLWLNEGFATYMQFKAVDSISPDWGMVDQFLIDQVHPVMNFDATSASHPIVQIVNTPNQITEIFDSISYNKGAAVLRMLENAMGDENFRDGIHNYLDKYKYDNAVTKNLWDELQTFAKEFNVQEVMNTWTVQMGYPVVNVKKDGDKYILTQKRFLADPETKNQGPSSVYNYTYSIPITYVSDKNTNIVTKKWFHNNMTEESFMVPNSKWVKINYKQAGYYRVNYTGELWETLTEHYYNQTVSDKANLLDDSFALAKAGELHYKYALNLSKILVNEKEYVAWSSVMKRLKELQKFLKHDFTIYAKYQAHVHEIIGKLYDELDWEVAEDTHLNSLLRGNVLDFGCSFGLEKCKNSTVTRFYEWLNNDEPLPVQMKEIIYVYGMEEIKKVDWDKVFEIYMKENDAQEKLRLLHGLASASNIKLLTTLLAQAKNETIVRSQDYFTCLRYISINEAGTELVWSYVSDNWSKLVDRFTLNDRYLGQLIPAITSSFTSEIQLKKMEEFFAKYPEAGAGEISRKQALETVKNNINWISKFRKDVQEWLEQNQK